MTDQAPNTVSGTLELNEKGPGYLREQKRNYAVVPANPQIGRDLIGRHRLRGGEPLTVTMGRGKKGRGRPGVTGIQSIGEKSPDAYGQTVPFEELPVIHPEEALKFETPTGSMSMRVIDLFTPIGKGQRGLIVAPPRTGKTVLLQQMAHGLMENHPEALLMMLLIDERPEEVTEMRRSICKERAGWHNDAPEVVFSNNDQDPKSHGRIAKLMIEKAKRHVEMGRDVVILLDSLTRLGRAFNNLVGSSGRTMTGGLDIRALSEPKSIFGAARKIEDGGSLTIIASVLIETGSRMDDFIFQEFKGTGNMELVLSRDLANLRMYPAVNLSDSGTRKEEMLLGQETYDKMSRIRRRLLSSNPIKQMETILAELGKYRTNADYIKNLA